MKFSVNELEKALKEIKKQGTVEVDVSFDSRERLVITYSDNYGGDLVSITIYDADTNKMATITRTARL